MHSLFSKLFKSFALMGVMFLFWACGGGSEQQSAASEEFAAAKEEIASDIDTYIKDLPPPSEVPFLLMATGSDFNSDLVNSLDNADRYTTSIDKAALNLGVYATDIGYLSSYDQSEDVFASVEVCQRLAEVIGVASAIDIDLITRFEENIGQRDSLAVLIDEVMAVTGERLQTLDRINLAAVALGGSFVEGLYISTMVIDTYPDDLLPEASRNLILEPLVKIVIDQKKTLEDLITVMKEVEQNQTITDLTGELEKLKAIYDEDLTVVEEQISSNTGDFQLTKDVISRLTEEVKRIRASLIS